MSEPYAAITDTPCQQCTVMVENVRADRLLALLLLLQSRGKLTAADLAGELEVSVRTIYRDIEALGNAGVPVFAEAGPGGGCRLLPGYRSPLDALSRDEVSALLILGVPAPLRELGLDTAVAAAQRRVRQAAAPRSAVPERLVHLDMPRWFHPREETPHLPALARAVQLRLVTNMSYGSGSGSGRNRGTRPAPKRRPVEPLGLVNKAGVWYLVAGAAKGVTAFRISRIASVDVSDEAFERPPDFDLESFWIQWSEEFASSRPRLAVTVRASPRAIAILPEVMGDAVHPAIDAAGAPDANGWQVLTLTFEHVHAAAHRLAGLAGQVEVIEPLEVREMLIAAAEQTLRLYQPSR